jgi:aryl-alcohol dehydrogenase (NADP+)
MDHVALGHTGLRVSRLCLGTMTFGHQCDEETSMAILDAADDAGITFLDTADVYPLGGSWDARGTTEDIVGRWLRGKRDRFIVATKCVGQSGPASWDRGASRQNITRAIEASLRRLRTDHVDLYQLHAWDRETPIDETLRALDDLVRAGKVRYVGVSNAHAYQIARSLGRSEVLGVGRFVSVQPRYNLLFREIERELLPMCAEEGLGVIPYNPVAGGMLTGKHRPADGPAAGGRFALERAGELYRDRYWHDRQFATLDALTPLAADDGRSLAELAVAWVLANPVVTAPIVGASRPEQLADAVRAARRPLDAERKAELDDLTHEYRFGDAER